MLLQQSIASLVIVVVSASLLHVLFLAVMFVATMGIPMRPPERVAMIIMCAQKSAPVTLTLISFITSSPTEQGLLAVPALVGQLAQIFIGSLLSGYLKRMAQLE